MARSFKYLGDDEREIPALHLVIQPGDTFKVEDPAIADGLEGQVDLFEKVSATAVPKSTTKVEERP